LKELAKRPAANEPGPAPELAPAQISLPTGYGPWLTKLKADIRAAQLRASIAVNRELVLLDWRIGHDILERQAKAATATRSAKSRQAPAPIARAEESAMIGDRAPSAGPAKTPDHAAVVGHYLH